MNFSYLHVVDAKNREEALKLQQPFFEELVAPTKPWRIVYLTGTIEDIIAQIELREKMGVELMFLFPLSLDVNQLDIWNKEIIPLFR